MEVYSSSPRISCSSVIKEDGYFVSIVAAEHALIMTNDICMSLCTRLFSASSLRSSSSPTSVATAASQCPVISPQVACAFLAYYIGTKRSSKSQTALAAAAAGLLLADGRMDERTTRRSRFYRTTDDDSTCRCSLKHSANPLD